MPCIPMPDGIISTSGGPFKPGDPPPLEYVAWHEWADVQRAAGLRQRYCPDCRKWLFPQEACPREGG